MSAFSAIHRDFEAFLNGNAVASGNSRFVARNFLLDPRVDAARAGEYARAIGSGAPASTNEWHAAHEEYLNEHIRVPATFDGSRPVDPSRPGGCPQCFLGGDALSAFEGTDLKTEFIRMVDIATLAQRAGRTAAEVRALGEKVLANRNPHSPEWFELDAVLYDAATAMRPRPVFAGFYDDFVAELSAPDDTTWPDRLRDRLGLQHLSPQPGPIGVFLFKYKAEEVPWIRGDATRRPIAIPTVLDHSLAEAFCPAPRELPDGRTLNLSGEMIDPAREVLHLFMQLRPQHLLRVSTIKNRVPDDLARARGVHLFMLHMLIGADEYGRNTDGDLL